MAISSISGIDQTLPRAFSIGKTQGESFQNILTDAIKNANQNEKEDVSQTVELLSGDATDLHTAMITMEKADIALQFAVQIRNKVLDAYNEVMRMQL